MKASGIITLTTDFGLADPYVAVMKGVILSIAPQARIVDLTHHIHHGGVVEATLLLREAYGFFPRGTVHVAVVDPGVGSERRAILIVTRDFYFVGPDNGIFWPIVQGLSPMEVIHLTAEDYFLPRISHTFHGRDIFAPVAAHLVQGAVPRRMGTPITDPARISFPEPRQTIDSLTGEVIRVDRFGNLITNIHRRVLDRFLGLHPPTIRIGSRSISGIRRTYADGEVGDMIALIGSSEFLEIAANLARACDLLEKTPEDCVGLTVEVLQTASPM
jgi:hypothetical protein